MTAGSKEGDDDGATLALRKWWNTYSVVALLILLIITATATRRSRSSSTIPFRWVGTPRSAISDAPRP